MRAGEVDEVGSKCEDRGPELWLEMNARYRDRLRGPKREFGTGGADGDIEHGVKCMIAVAQLCISVGLPRHIDGV
jgi:hypothetical protein